MFPFTTHCSKTGGWVISHSLSLSVVFFCSCDFIASKVFGCLISLKGEGRGKHTHSSLVYASQWTWGNIATKRLFSPESPIWILAEVTLNLSMTLRKKELLFNIVLSQLGTQMTRHSVQVSSTASQFSLPGLSSWPGDSGAWEGFEENTKVRGLTWLGAVWASDSSLPWTHFPRVQMGHQQPPYGVVVRIRKSLCKARRIEIKM